MKKYILILVFAFNSLQAQFVNIDLDCYSTVFDTLTSEPIYSYYQINFQPYETVFGRNSITANPLLSSKKQPSRKDYAKNYKYDRGHLAPVLDFASDANCQRQINYYTNVAPQEKNLNRGVWRDLEDYVHNLYISDYQPFYVITGVVYGYRKLGKLRVPLYWYKIIKKDNFEKAWLVPNENPTSTNFAYYEVDPQTVKNYVFQYGFHHF